MGGKVKEMIVTILILAGAIFTYHVLFVREYCKEETKNYLILKIREKKCANGINFLLKKYEKKRISVLPPWAK